ncbi:hypothetical protein K3G39_20135 [Pontibacter sp. HSC-14F20]|uniref:hypothetical protein n=1 Tax=Pontibacter sp. HSC-14F20 TaxID=2864136 RepID=UPI001C72CDB5|nr:hypothetical protein [Pontibacter sp. HSC-14F20]MBX0335547.1 hypothetical protein [Pontibacter sp. HSC-14F20]
MTYIVGFIEKDSVFLFSDTAITVLDKVNNLSFSSFGESSFIDNNKSVYQSELKLYNFKSNLIIGGAGNSKSIDDFIHNLTTYLDYGLSVEKSINCAINEINTNDFDLLIGYRDGFTPILKIKESYSLSLQLVSNITFIGIGSTHHKQFSSDFKDLKKQTCNFKSWTVEQLSLVITSILQAYGIWNYTLHEGVGGVFTGLYMHENGISWQPTIGYIVFDVNLTSLSQLSDVPQAVLPSNLFTNPTYIFVSEEENAFYVASPKPNYTGFLFRSIEMKDVIYLDNWYNKYADELLNRYLNFEVDFLVFISSNTRVISIFTKNEIQKRNIALEFEEQLILKFNIGNNNNLVQTAEFINIVAEPSDENITLKLIFS